MAIKKSELYSSLWKSCDELRGGMDASQYKDYVLVLLFVKYVSDKYAGKPFAPIEIPDGGSFQDMVKLKGQKHIGEGINVIISTLAKANELEGIITVTDFNNDDKLGKGNEMVDRLTRLVGIFQNPALDFSKNRAEGDDILGDAYEYLMRHFATESGKSKGQFYTPAEVSRVIAKVIGISQVESPSATLYDPTCGSGSLLLKAADETPSGVTIYGQDMDNATRALAKMNMILHDNPSAEIAQGNSLASPEFKEDNGRLRVFDFVVANPPFSTKAWSSGFDPSGDLYTRFKGFGVPPAKNGDYAFLLHVLRSLKSTGKGAVILPHGVLFRGNAEGEIRKNIIERGYIKGIIALPANLFYGTGIPACILVIDKENAAARKGIFMIDAGRGFVKDGNKNRLRHQDIHKIVDVFNRQTNTPGYARMVGLAEIIANDYNLNIPRYIVSSETEDIQDIEAHLRGGIPNRDIAGLNAYWQVCPALRDTLFCAAGQSGYMQMRPATDQVKTTIYAHSEFVHFSQQVERVFEAWQARNMPLLKGIDVDAKPKPLIEQISEDVLRTFTDLPLLDSYDVYQHLMRYWTDTMQDDVYQIAVDGWQANPDLIPPPLIVARYFEAERQVIEEREAERDALSSEREEMEEEHGGEEGALESLKSEKGKISRNSVVVRLREISKEIKDGLFQPEEADAERVTLTAYLELFDREIEANRAVKAARADLDAKVAAKYAALTPDEIKSLVVDDKWMDALHADVRGELERVSHVLTGRIQELAERYDAPLPQRIHEAEALSCKVEAHLAKMGYAWN